MYVCRFCCDLENGEEPEQLVYVPSVFEGEARPLQAGDEAFVSYTRTQVRDNARTTCPLQNGLNAADADAAIQQ